MNKVSTKSKLIFAFGGLGKDAMFAMSTVMLFYFTALIGISPLFAGAMMMIVRIWDAINDPIMGGIVANTHSKMGKFRPWILIGSLLNAIVLVFVFLNPSFGPNTIRMYVYVTVFYTLWGMTYTLMDIPFWSMIPALSQSQKERETITVLTRFFTSIGYFIIAAGYLDLASFLGGAATTEGQIRGLFYLSIIVSIIFFLSELLLVFNVKEKVVPKDLEKITLKNMFDLLKNNDQLLVVMAVVLIANFVLYITSGMAVYFISYDIGNQSLYLTFISLGGVLQVIGSLMFPLFKKKFNRKGIFNLSIIFQIIGFFLLFLNAFILNNVILLVFLIGAIIFFGQGLQMVLQTVLLSDTVEYGEYKLGTRSEALAFSVQTFIVKLAMGLSLGIIGVGLELFNFVPNVGDTPQPQSDFTIIGMRIMMFILPIIGLILSLRLFNKKHTLNEARYETIVHALKERNNYDENSLEL
jgi:melibiose permease